MKNIKKTDKQQVDQTENLVLDTKGGEMPDADRKAGEKASDAAKVFEKKNETTERVNKDSDKVRNQLVVDEDGDQQDRDTEIDPELQKKAS